MNKIRVSKDVINFRSALFLITSLVKCYWMYVRYIPHYDSSPISQFLFHSSLPLSFLVPSLSLFHLFYLIKRNIQAMPQAVFESASSGSKSKRHSCVSVDSFRQSKWLGRRPEAGQTQVASAPQPPRPNGQGACLASLTTRIRIHLYS